MLSNSSSLVFYKLVNVSTLEFSYEKSERVKRHWTLARFCPFMNIDLSLIELYFGPPSITSNIRTFRTAQVKTFPQKMGKEPHSEHCIVYLSFNRQRRKLKGTARPEPTCHETNLG